MIFLLKVPAVLTMRFPQPDSLMVSPHVCYQDIRNDHEVRLFGYVNVL